MPVAAGHWTPATRPPGRPPGPHAERWPQRREKHRRERAEERRPRAKVARTRFAPAMTLMRSTSCAIGPRALVCVMDLDDDVARAERAPTRVASAVTPARAARRSGELRLSTRGRAWRAPGCGGARPTAESNGRRGRLRDGAAQAAAWPRRSLGRAASRSDSRIPSTAAGMILSRRSRASASATVSVSSAVKRWPARPRPGSSAPCTRRAGRLPDGALHLGRPRICSTRSRLRGSSKDPSVSSTTTGHRGASRPIERCRAQPVPPATRATASEEGAPNLAERDANVDPLECRLGPPERSTGTPAPPGNVTGSRVAASGARPASAAQAAPARRARPALQSGRPPLYCRPSRNPPPFPVARGGSYEEGWR